MHSNLGAKMGCGAIFPLGHQCQQSLDCVCSETKLLEMAAYVSPHICKLLHQWYFEYGDKVGKLAMESDSAVCSLYSSGRPHMPKPPGGFHKKPSRTIEVKPDVLKNLGPQYMRKWGTVFVSLVIPHLFYKNIIILSLST